MAWAVLLAGCASAPREAAKAESPPPSPHVELEKPEFGETEGGKPLWKATATSAAYGLDNKTATLKAVSATFYDDGKPATHATAPVAKWEQTSRAFKLDGGITLTVLDGSRGAKAQRAHWNAALGKVEATGDVSFWQGANRLNAHTLYADRTLGRVELKGDVKGQLALGTLLPPPRSKATGTTK